MEKKTWPLSKTIAGAKYDRETQKLIVVFVRGAVYQYIGVPAEIWESWIQCESAGSYFQQAIARVYPYQRID